MADKRINDMQARSSFDATCNVPVDDASQSWRVTGAQMLAYFAANVTALASWITGQTADTDPASGDHVLTYDLSATSLKKVTLANMWKDRVRAVTTTDTATAEDDTLLVDSTDGAFTQTLPTAVGIKGKRYTFVKTNTGTTAITVDGNGSETIGGVTTRALRTKNDRLTIVSDNANWQIVEEDIQVFALLRNSGNVVMASGTIILDTAVRDTHGAYNTSTGVFTVPAGEAGVYECTSSNLTLTGAGAEAAGFTQNAGTRNHTWTFGGTGTVGGGATKFDCAVGDTIKFESSGSGSSLSANAFISIQKIGH